MIICLLYMTLLTNAIVFQHMKNNKKKTVEIAGEYTIQCNEKLS